MSTLQLVCGGLEEELRIINVNGNIDAGSQKDLCRCGFAGKEGRESGLLLYVVYGLLPVVQQGPQGAPSERSST